MEGMAVLDEDAAVQTGIEFGRQLLGQLAQYLFKTINGNHSTLSFRIYCFQYTIGRIESHDKTVNFCRA